jgi:diguanylate cyclase (GGDEF)-like protein/PAS domain S-box-containing protein
MGDSDSPRTLPASSREAAAERAPSSSPGSSDLQGTEPMSPGERVDLISEFSGHGSWRIERATGELVLAGSLFQHEDLVAVDRNGREALRQTVHPQDLGAFDTWVRRAFQTGEGFTHAFRMRRANGAWRTITCSGAAQRKPGGEISSVSGVFIDSTELEIGRILAERGNDIISQSDAAGVLTYVSASIESVTGFRPEALLGRRVSDLIGTEVVAEMERAIAQCLAEPDSGARAVEFSTLHKDGRVVWLESRLIPMFDRLTGERSGVTDVLRDVTQRKIAEERLEDALVTLQTLIESSPTGILLIDKDRRVSAYNHRFAEMWDVPPAVLDSGDLHRVLRHAAAHVKDGAAERRRIRGLARDPQARSKDEIETKDGRWIGRYTVPVQTAGKGYLGRAWFFEDMTDHRRALDDAVRMSRYDHLTGLANRAALFEALHDAIATAGRRDQGFGVFCLDLDNFKDVNDTMGHLVGDQLLVAVAQRLQGLVSERDVVARPGGDEFAILVADVRTATEAAIFADRLIREVGAAHIIEGRQIHTSVSIGIDLFGPDAADARTLLSHADMALYQAKLAGTGAYRFFTESMDAEVRTRVTLGSELREAIHANQLFLLYQPEVELATGRVVGAEALVRWRHPKRGVLGPDLFVPVAEQMGLICALGRWVLWAAARQARAWADAGLVGVRMGVNVSALQFKTPAALEADIAAVLVETGVPPSLLELELTETALMTASEGGDILTRLHQSGVRIAIDDFGTGYSSLDYLRRFPASRIKIAQTFVRHLGSRAGDAAIVKATIGLARELGMTTIAEGVETRGQLEMLRDWGCAEGQGYLFDRPLTAQDATHRLTVGRYGDDGTLARLFAG